VDAAVQMTGVVKTFGPTRALDGLDLEVAPGEVHGFIGPNGAGKTTAIRVVLGLLRADAGRTVVLGGDPWRDAVALHRRLAYVPGDVSLWPGLTGGEAIDLLARLRGGLDRARRDDLLERFLLDPSKKARSYSKGNRQKVALVAALASDAELLVLDEPTSGLDPLMEATFQECIREVRTQGRTVLLSSHILAEAEALCDRVSIIRLGRVVQSGTLAELRHLTRTAVAVETVRPLTGLDALAGVHDVRAEDGRVTFEVDGDAMARAVEHLAGFGVRSMTSHPPTLEELFLRHYGDEPAEAAAGSGPGEGPPGVRDGAGPASRHEAGDGGVPAAPGRGGLLGSLQRAVRALPRPRSGASSGRAGGRHARHAPAQDREPDADAAGSTAAPGGRTAP
jgi:ABC-2 type transport system ATP-binding protein